MQRLTNARGKQDRERGATAVVAALVLVVLLGMAALGVDVGALWWDRKELQNGADAGALAIAQACAANPSDPECSSGANPTALAFAEDNKLDANANGYVVEIGASHVTVQTESTRQLWFANAFGVTASPVSALATASWGQIGGASTIPLTIAECAFDPATIDNPAGWVRLTTKSPNGVGDGEDPCGTSNTPHVIPGGFHWLKPDYGCVVETDAFDNAPSDTGNVQPNTCSPNELNALLQSGEVLIPIFDTATGNGSKGVYHLVGYAAFVPTAYCLTTSHVKWNTNAKDRKCTGSERWIEGYFVRFVSLDGEPADPDNPPGDFGATMVRLTG